MIGCFIKWSVQLFQPIIVIYRRRNHYWGCTSFYRPLSYPLRSLKATCWRKITKGFYFFILLWKYNVFGLETGRFFCLLFINQMFCILHFSYFWCWNSNNGNFINILIILKRTIYLKLPDREGTMDWKLLWYSNFLS